jgi:hypothetical protein
MIMLNRIVWLAVAGLLVGQSSALAAGPQRRAAGRAASSAAAVVRTVKGNLRGNVIAVRSVADRPVFDYALTEARVVNGKLELLGSIRPAGRKATKGGAASATLVGSLAKDPDPEYFVQRAKRNAARTGRVQPAPGQPAEQKPGGPATTSEAAGEMGQLAQSTQSTARTTPEVVGPEGVKPKDGKTVAAATGVSGCEVMFLRMQLPAAYAAAAGGRSVQLNVSVAAIDNKTGIDINRRLCRVVNALQGGGGSVDAEVAELNRLLGGAR